MNMRRWHRWVMTLVGILIVYVSTTGIIIQLIDLKTLYSGAQASDPVMNSIREGTTGPPGFAVIATNDYSAETLPTNVDPQALLSILLKAARKVVSSGRFNWVELRMAGTTPVGIVSVAGTTETQLTFNAVTGAMIGIPREVSPLAAFDRPPRSIHDVFKSLHRGDAIGRSGLWVGMIVDLGLLFLVLSGLTVYFKTLFARQKTGRNSWFWS